MIVIETHITKRGMRPVASVPVKSFIKGDFLVGLITLLVLRVWLKKSGWFLSWGQSRWFFSWGPVLGQRRQSILLVKRSWSFLTWVWLSLLLLWLLPVANTVVIHSGGVLPANSLKNRLVAQHGAAPESEDNDNQNLDLKHHRHLPNYAYKSGVSIFAIKAGSVIDTSDNSPLPNRNAKHSKTQNKLHGFGNRSQCSDCGSENKSLTVSVLVSLRE